MTSIGTISEAKIEGSSFEWKIPDFFSHADFSGHCSSPSFSFSGCDWRLEMLPRNEEWMPMRLEREHSDSDKTVTYDIGIKKADGTLEKYAMDSLTRTFKRNAVYADCDVIWDLYDLRKRRAQLASSETVTFTLHIWDRETTPAISVQKASEFMELETLSSDFKDLIVGQKICDATLKVRDKEFKAHRVVLAARSSVFSAMFENTMSEQETGVVNVPDCDSESFGEFLKYLYTGKLEGVSERSARQLYVTADKYDVQQLKSFSVKYMQKHMCVDDFCDVIDLAELYADDQLMSSAQTFFNGKYAEIISTSKWERLMERNCRLANILLKAAFCKI